ncbi:efflux RND transporter permease subunit [Pseudopontixanthobacter vadosimaris]|uniref:efflux RND transporter permease subunit n=1 Tax=Pseudopontixanthobacter vadosimaris TaxID=2726450 RepID=UPI001472A463|nr:efflux RND transporter permease subunit [Pseudopontixanthobacter vadosimaris]
MSDRDSGEATPGNAIPVNSVTDADDAAASLSADDAVNDPAAGDGAQDSPAEAGPVEETDDGREDAGNEESDAVADAGPLARFFFLKTTFGILLTTLLVVGGVMAYFSLVKESLPDLDIPQATITTTWPGADPATIEEQVTQEIEDELTTLAGVKAINSASFDSFSLISVEFEASADSGEAIARLREKVADAEAELPSEAEKPTIEQVSVDDRPVLTVALYGDAGPAAFSALGEDLQDRLERVGGVNEVDLAGVRQEIVQVLLEPQRLLALGLSPVEVRNAITRANLEQPFGEIDSEEIGAVVRLEGQFRTVDDLRALPVTRFGDGATGRPVLLGEVATVRRQLETEDSRTFYSKGGERYRPSVSLSVKKIPGSDTIQLIDDVIADIEAFSETSAWPQGVEFAIVQNGAETIWDSLISVFNNGWQAMLAVFIILFLVLSWREGLIAGLSIPVTFCGVLIVILLMGYSLNELVIIGMVLALGLLVDVFILMMEGLHEDIYANRKSFGEAVLGTIGRYAIPALAGQLTTILALAPLMAIGGVSGKFIRVLPITAIACLVLAYIVALFAAVPLSRYLLQRAAEGGAQDKTSKADEISVRASHWLENWTQAHIISSRKRAWAWVGGAVAMFVLSCLAIAQTSLVLYPKTDGDNLGINIELPASTQLQTSQRVADGVGKILLQKPYLADVLKLVGSKSPFAGGSVAASLQPSSAENFIGFSATFVERGDRDAPGFEIADDLREELRAYLDANVAGADLLVVPETGQPTTGDPIEIVLTGPEMGELQDLSQQVQAVLEDEAGVVDVRDNLGSVTGEIALRPNREALDFFGLTQADLAAQIRFALSNDQVGEFVTPGPEDDLEIHIGTDWPSQQGYEAGGPSRYEELALVRAFTPSGESVSLLSLLEPVQSEAAVAVSHKDGQRALTVLAKNQDRAVTEIIDAVTPAIEEVLADAPAGYAFAVGGEAEETAETFGSAGIALVVAVIMVFGVLVIVFDSFPQAFILITTMPLALIGTFLGFFAFGLSLSFFAVVGVIALIGIVVNNGIVMVDTMNTRLQEGFSIADAAARGAADRLRPILTTSVTTIVGLAPLAIGSPMYRPMCLAIMFGLVSSTVLSLFLIPALYTLLTRKSRARAEMLD